ncbi:hypothetical protein [Brucella rhizosphaerae]|uniref:Uncharacterized protein n=1 Tax=Brucella rhizosphaerae TaxID=571254 RepID=A0A256FKV9_9HYPH|nr:hypothetical protein [Brucella rhizosphaerae]OYR15494.1 hypothetical protein CEV32_4769 [Brucella rhizosphaerae]
MGAIVNVVTPVGNGTGKIARSLALTGFTLALLLAVAGLIFWNAVLPFYGVLYLWGN